MAKKKAASKPKKPTAVERQIMALSQTNDPAVLRGLLPDTFKKSLVAALKRFGVETLTALIQLINAEENPPTPAA